MRLSNLLTVSPDLWECAEACANHLNARGYKVTPEPRDAAYPFRPALKCVRGTTTIFVEVNSRVQLKRLNVWVSYCASCSSDTQIAVCVPEGAKIGSKELSTLQNLKIGLYEVAEQRVNEKIAPSDKSLKIELPELKNMTAKMRKVLGQSYEHFEREQWRDGFRLACVALQEEAKRHLKKWVRSTRIEFVALDNGDEVRYSENDIESMDLDQIIKAYSKIKYPNLSDATIRQALEEVRKDYLSSVSNSRKNNTESALRRNVGGHMWRIVNALKGMNNVNVKETVEGADNKSKINQPERLRKKNTMKSGEITSRELIDVVIITALPKEHDAVISYLDEVKPSDAHGSKYQIGTIGKYKVVVPAPAGMGNPNAAVATTQAIDVWNPQFVIVTGIAGGVLKDDRLLGDVIVAEQVVGYEQGRTSENGIDRRVDVIRPAHKLLEAAQKLKPENWVFSSHVPRPDGTTSRVVPQVHFGVVASGEKVVAGGDLIKELQSTWSKLAAVEMEGYGTGIAIYKSDSVPGMLLVKAICDWADPSKNDDWQQYAAHIAAAFTASLLKTSPFEPREVTSEFSEVSLPSAVRKTPMSYKGESKLMMCRGLVDDWEDLADYFAIPLHDRTRFKAGRGCQGVYEWLEQRSMLDALPNGLTKIGRDDLVTLLVPIESPH